MGSVVVADGLVARGLWALPGLGIKPTSPALAVKFLTIGPPGKFGARLYMLTLYCQAY